MSDTIEKTYIQLDSVKLTGLSSEYDQYNATSKAYVDSTVNTAINSLVNGAGPSMDTLKEIADALNNNPSIASVLTSQISSVSASVTREAVARSDAEAVLRAGLGMEVSDRTIADDILREATDNEVRDRAYEDGQLRDKINNEVSTREYEINRVEHSHATTATVLFSKVEENKNEIVTESLVRASEDLRFMDMVSVEMGVTHGRLNDLSMQLESEGMARNTADVDIGARCDLIELGNAIEKSERKSEDVSIRASIVAANENLFQESLQRSTEVALLQASKFDKTGGLVSGAVQVQGDVIVDSYLYFSSDWRVKGSADGKRLTFEHRKNGVFRTALPFICAP